jgi:hypothetical protein
MLFLPLMHSLRSAWNDHFITYLIGNIPTTFIHPFLHMTCNTRRVDAGERSHILVVVVVVYQNQDHMEPLDVSGIAKHNPIDVGATCSEGRRNGNAVLVTGEGVQDQDL